MGASYSSLFHIGGGWSDNHTRRSSSNPKDEEAVTCGLGWTKTLDRIGQTVVGECTHLCDTRMDTSQKYQLLRDGSDSHRASSLLPEGVNTFLLSKHQTLDGIDIDMPTDMTHKEISRLAKLELPIPRSFPLAPSGPSDPRARHILSAGRATTAKSRISNLLEALTASRNSAYVSQSAKLFVSAGPLRGTDAILARSLHIEEDILFEIDGGRQEVRIPEDDAPIYHEIGILFSAGCQRLLSLATKFFAIARLVMPNNLAYQVNYFQAMMRFGDNQNILVDIKEACDRFPAASECRWQMALALLQHDRSRGTLELALKYLRDACQFDYSNPEYATTMATTLELLAVFHTGEVRKSLLTEAVRSYEHSYTLDPSPKTFKSMRHLQGVVHPGAR